MDAGYGADTRLRSALAELGLAHVAGVQPHTSVWTRANPSPAVRPWSGRGRATSRMVRDRHHHRGLCHSGRAELMIEGQTITLEPGDSWLVPADAEHSYRIIEIFTAVEATAPPPKSTAGTKGRAPA